MHKPPRLQLLHTPDTFAKIRAQRGMQEAYKNWRELCFISGRHQIDFICYLRLMGKKRYFVIRLLRM